MSYHTYAVELERYLGICSHSLSESFLPRRRVLFWREILCYTWKVGVTRTVVFAFRVLSSVEKTFNLARPTKL